MECLDRLDMALRRLWFGLATRLGIRKTGLMKLRHEVSTCEYEDVRVMWELLRKANGAGAGALALDFGRCSPTATPRSRGARRGVWPVFRWAARAPRRLCSSF